MNGAPDFEARLRAVEQTSSANTHAIGRLISVGADAKRMADGLSEMRQDFVGRFKGLGVQFESLSAQIDELAKSFDQKLEALGKKFEAVATTAEHAKARSELAVVHAERASVTNEADPTPNVDAHPSRSPVERVVADVAGDLSVDALRTARRSSLVRTIALIVAMLLGGGAAGARLQACTSTSSSPSK